jgi:hypothetical protein
MHPRLLLLHAPAKFEVTILGPSLYSKLEELRRRSTRKLARILPNLDQFQESISFFQITRYSARNRL